MRKLQSVPLLLYTYLITETLAPFFASLIIVTGILFLGRLIPLFDLIIELGISAPNFIRLCSYMTPNLFLFAIPMASMLGVILCFTRMGNDNELIALKAAGTGLYRMLPAIIFFALCTSLLTGYFSTTLIPKGTASMKELFFQLVKEKIDKGLKEKKFSEGLPDVVVYIEEIDPDTKKWQEVYVSDTRDKENPLTIISQSGNLIAKMSDMMFTLQLDNGSIHHAKETTSQTISFENYSVNIPLQHPDAKDKKKADSISKKEMSQQEIREYVAQHGTTSSKSISRLIEYHQRLALPGGCFILTILGLPLALRTRPGQRSIGVPLGLLIFICYYVCLTGFKTIGEEGTLPVLLAMWSPNVIFGILTILILRFANRESTNVFIDFLLRSIFFTFSRIPKPWKKKKP